MEFENSRHVHPYPQKMDGGDKISCFSCKELVSPSYHCPRCHIFLEKKLEELPGEIKHPLHRRHLLFLCMQSPYQSGSCICDLCAKAVDEFIYHCSHCKFDLDIKCALPPCIIEPGRLDAHRFVHLMRTISFICDACGTAGDDSPYLCTMCQLMLHDECISLPTAIRITEHDHRISHKYFLHENESISAHPYCGICHEGLKIEHGAYYCRNCNYAVHVNCAKQHIIKDETTAEDEDHPNALTDGSRAGEIVVPDEEGAQVTKNQQFCHEHDLIIIDDENAGDNKRCDGCMLPLSAPITGCPRCHLFLHKKCSELPAKLRHPLHNHSLTLLPNAPSVDGVFRCSACDQYCHGFSYNCDRCDFYLDVRCSAISKELEHHGHEHLLHLALEERNYGCYCNSCYQGKFTYFCCNDCDFTLDFGCATLPNMVTHRFDDHPLKLRFGAGHDPHDYCEDCEKKRDPEFQFYDKAPWFYHCPDCNHTFHPDCILGSFPYIKFEGAYLYDIHPHPLTLVQKDKHYPPCDNCAEPFFVGKKVGDPSHDLALQCTECKFVIHRKDPCFSQHMKAGKIV